MLKSAQLSSLVHDFDDICLSLDRIILRKWNSPYKITKQEVKEEYKYDENTSKYSSRIFVYLKKGHTYYMSSYINDSYTIIVDKVKYIVLVV